VEVESAVAEQPFLHRGGLVGGEVVQDDVDVQFGGDVAIDLVQEGDEVGAGVGRLMSVITLPVAISRAANRSQVPLRW
jgi:hypothetical protein